MKARDVMTCDVASVRPDAPRRVIAQVLIDRGISAVPVVDENSVPIGMVSEGDLIGRGDSDREARRDWWLTLLAEGEALSPEFIAGLRNPERVARDIMSAPIVTVDEETDLSKIAELLVAHRIKRVPVVRDGRIVGIVSRADLVRAFSQERSSPVAAPREGFLAHALNELDEHFTHRRHPVAQAPAGAHRDPHDIAPSATDFRNLAADHDNRERQHREDTRRAAAVERRRKVADLIDHHISEESWRILVHQAREAAEHGQKEFMLLRFPSQLCSDGGRAINVIEPAWPDTLRGEAQELYRRWERDLKPQGFRLAARVLEFPGGLPGDIALLLVWGK
ncbi:MAG TPA: CBS domain-containing protein [Alphaproteobacteria bacterium]|nr:CBS domain-containing protein [Alphaproteobacteria bacterium]